MARHAGRVDPYDCDVVVIGSGFGGGVAALRAAQAGRSVVVAEMGRRIEPSEMSQGARSLRTLLWEPRLGLRGYFRQTLLRNVTVVGGVGVGGGSLVYAAVLLRPGATALSAPGWAGLGIDWERELDAGYASAAAMLGRQVTPELGLQDKWLATAATAMGVGDTFGPTPMGIDFAACRRCGQCITGCPYGAKSTTADTYLAAAEDLGAQIRPGTTVEILVPLGDRGTAGWKVVTRDSFSGRIDSLVAREVVVAAGVLGSVRLLLACRDRWATMPDLSPRLGQRVRTNSEAFAAVLHPPGTDVSAGATISSDFYPDASTHVTNNRFPRSYSFMRWYLSPAVPGRDPRTRRRQTLSRLVRHPWRSTANIRARQWHRRVTILTVMQHSDNELVLRLRRRLGRWMLSSEPPAGASPVPTFLPQADEAGAAVADAGSGQPFSTILESVFGIGATAHILGGAVMGPDRETGVVDDEQRVFGYHNLRVMDGSVVPENIGVNPSWTITALAERACARWLEGDRPR